ncbi:MAG TPA: site-specific integrase [Terriglobales bacterium]
MKLFKKRKSKFFWYDFTVRGQRYRGSTEEVKEARASKIAGIKLAAALEGTDPLDRKAPTLQDFSPEFLQWVGDARLSDATRKYYRDGWRLLSQKKELRVMRMDRITNDDVERQSFPGFASNTNCAIRTLSRMLHKAEDKKLIRQAPRLKRVIEFERELLLDERSEKRLLGSAAECRWSAVSYQLFEDIVKLTRDTGMRNRRETYRMRVENLDWENRIIFVPDSKTKDGRRRVPMTDRVYFILRRRCGNENGVLRKEGWVFPSRRKTAKRPHLHSIAKHFAEARKKAGLPKNLVLYCGRHDYGTRMMAKTGNLKAVMVVMGQKDVKTAQKYQHREFEIIRAAVNETQGLPA